MDLCFIAFYTKLALWDSDRAKQWCFYAGCICGPRNTLDGLLSFGSHQCWNKTTEFVIFETYTAKLLIEYWNERGFECKGVYFKYHKGAAVILNILIYYSIFGACYDTNV